MSDKKRRDITLGEMQDECNIKSCNECNFSDICMFYKTRPIRDLSLTDPPRFNEAQMAALKESYDSGVLSMTRHDGMMCYQMRDFTIAITDNGIAEKLQIGETLDLAELLGKDGTNAQT